MTKPPEPTIYEPVPGHLDQAMPCRRGAGSVLKFQGRPVPRCDGTVTGKGGTTVVPTVRASCTMCGMAHMFTIEGGDVKYGALM